MIWFQMKWVILVPSDVVWRNRLPRVWPISRHTIQISTYSRRDWSVLCGERILKKLIFTEWMMVPLTRWQDFSPTSPNKVWKRTSHGQKSIRCLEDYRDFDTFIREVRSNVLRRLSSANNDNFTERTISYSLDLHLVQLRAKFGRMEYTTFEGRCFGRSGRKLLGNRRFITTLVDLSTEKADKTTWTHPSAQNDPIKLQSLLFAGSQILDLNIPPKSLIAWPCDGQNFEAKMNLILKIVICKLLHVITHFEPRQTFSRVFGRWDGLGREPEFPMNTGATHTGKKADKWEREQYSTYLLRVKPGYTRSFAQTPPGVESRVIIDTSLNPSCKRVYAVCL